MASEEEIALKNTISQLASRLDQLKHEEAVERAHLEQLKKSQPNQRSDPIDDTSGVFTIDSLIAQADIVSSESSNYFASQVQKQLRTLTLLHDLIANTGREKELDLLVKYIAELNGANIEQRNLTKIHHEKLLEVLIASFASTFKEAVFRADPNVVKIRTQLNKIKSTIHLTDDVKFQSVYRCVFVNMTTTITESVFEINSFQSLLNEDNKRSCLSLMAKFIESQCQNMGLTLLLLDQHM